MKGAARLVGVWVLVAVPPVVWVVLAHVPPVWQVVAVAAVVWWVAWMVSHVHRVSVARPAAAAVLFPPAAVGWVWARILWVPPWWVLVVLLVVPSVLWWRAVPRPVVPGVGAAAGVFSPRHDPPDDDPDAGLAVDVAPAPGLPARVCAAVATAFKDAWAVVWDPTPKPAPPPPPSEPRTIIATRILPSLEAHSYRSYDAGPALTVEEAPREETAAGAVGDVVGRVVAAWDGAAAVMHMDELADRMGVDQTVLADLLERAGAPVDRKARKKRGGVSTPKMGMRREDVERWRNGFSTSGAPLG